MAVTTPIHVPGRRWRGSRRVAADIDRLLAGLRRRSTNGLHLGGGATRIEGLTNVDLFHPAADLNADATDLSTFPDGSVDWIETHHMLEHLSFEETDRALAEWARVLGPGGRLVVTCPDITRVSLMWLATSILPRRWDPDARRERLARMFVGPQIHPGMFHRNVFDARRLTRTVERHGFTVDLTHTPYPIRPTPSLLLVAHRNA